MGLGRTLRRVAAVAAPVVSLPLIAANKITGGNVPILNKLGKSDLFGKDLANPLGRSPDFSGSYANIAGIESQATLMGQSAASKKASLDATLRANLEREGAYTGELGRATNKRITSLQDQLTRSLEDVGTDAEAARMAVGESQASRGLLRSSFTQKGLEDVALGEQKQKANLRLESAMAQSDVQEQEKSTLRDMDTKKREAETNRQFADLMNTENQKVFLSESASRQKLDLDLAKAGIESSRRQQMTGLIGNLASTAGLLLAI